MIHASASCLVFDMQKMPWALVLALANAGNSRPARIAMMAMTTKSSINVKPLYREGLPAIRFVKSFIVLSTVVRLDGIRLTIGRQTASVRFDAHPAGPGRVKDWVRAGTAPA